MTDTITADQLMRNDRVALDPHDFPELVDSVRREGPAVYVVFSSGQEQALMADATVTIIV